MVSTVAITLINPPSPPILIVDSRVVTGSTDNKVAIRKQGNRATMDSTGNKVAIHKQGKRAITDSTDNKVAIHNQGNRVATSSTDSQVAINRVPTSISNPMVQAHLLQLAPRPL